MCDSPALQPFVPPRALSTDTSHPKPDCSLQWKHTPWPDHRSVMIIRMWWRSLNFRVDTSSRRSWTQTAQVQSPTSVRRFTHSWVVECFTLFTGPVSPNAAFVPSEAKTQRIFLRLFQSFHLLLCTHKLLLYLCLFTLQRSFQYLYNNLRCLKPSLDTVKSNWAAELVPLPLKIAGCSQ